MYEEDVADDDFDEAAPDDMWDDDDDLPQEDEGDGPAHAAWDFEDESDAVADGADVAADGPENEPPPPDGQNDTDGAGSPPPSPPPLPPPHDPGDAGGPPPPPPPGPLPPPGHAPLPQWDTPWGRLVYQPRSDSMGAHCQHTNHDRCRLNAVMKKKPLACCSHG